MIMKLEGIGDKELAELFLFLRSETNQRAFIHYGGEYPNRDCPIPFAEIKKCVGVPPAPNVEGYVPGLPLFELTLEVTDHYGDQSAPPHLLTKLMQMLGRFRGESAPT